MSIMQSALSTIFLLTITALIFAPLPCHGSGSCSCKKDNGFIRLGTFSRLSDARAACKGLTKSRCLMDECSSECPCNFSCKSSSKFTPLQVNNNMKFACDFKCDGGSGFCRANGKNDPHMHGFDGSHFDFHGEHGKTYAIFGRYDGEKLVARMRATKKSTTRIHHTFFDTFGLSTEEGKQVQISLINKHSKIRTDWKASVSIDGVPLEKNINSGSLTVSMLAGNKNVIVQTSLAIYYIKAARNKEEESQHLDVSIDLPGAPRQEADYIGVLGFTLNKALDVSIHESLEGHGLSREKALRTRFETDGLFPSHLKDVDAMRGISRFSRSNKPIKTPFIVTAGVSHPEKE